MARAAASTTPTRFTGFADRDARFFRALARNQRREWFQAHREEYEAGWLEPMRALLAEARARLDGAYARHPLAEPKVFRIHRDVRFGADKSPYKTHVGGYVAIEGAGTGPATPMPLYVHVAADEAFAAAGYYMMPPADLARFRAAVLDDGRGGELARIVTGLERAGFVVGSHDVLAKVPRGCPPEHPRADLLRRKGLVMMFPTLPRDLLVSPRLSGWLAKHATRAVPLVEWLASLGE